MLQLCSTLLMLSIAWLISPARSLEIDNGLLPSGSGAVRSSVQRFPMNAAGETECKATAAPADILFLVDGSSSVGDDDFQRIKKFISGVIGGFEVDSDIGSQFGIVQFSDVPKTEFSLKSHANVDQVRSAVSDLGYLEGDEVVREFAASGSTHTGAALSYLLSEELKESKGSRPGVRNVVVTITDGASQDDVEGPTALAATMGVELFAVAISADVNEAQLLQLAGGKPDHLFRVPDFDELHTTFRNKLVDQVCTVLDLGGAARDTGTSYGEGGSPNPKINCLPDRIELEAQTRNPFAGKVYVKGYYDNQACRFLPEEGSQSTDVRFSVPMEGCGVRRGRQLNPPGMYYEATVIVSFHKTFLTKVDRAFNVRCFFMEAAKTVSQTLDVSMLPTESLEDSGAMPTCTYSVRRGGPDGDAVKYAKVGEPLFHVWECPQDVSMYSMLINTCTIDDGRGKKVEMVDPRGCSTDPILLQDIIYDEGATRAYQETHAFKFADVMSVFFTCRISLCMKSEPDCQKLTPPSCGASSPSESVGPTDAPDYVGDYGGAFESTPLTAGSETMPTTPDYGGGGDYYAGDQTKKPTDADYGPTVDYGNGAFDQVTAAPYTDAPVTDGGSYYGGGEPDPVDNGPGDLDTPPPIPTGREYGGYGGDYGPGPSTGGDYGSGPSSGGDYVAAAPQPATAGDYGIPAEPAPTGGDYGPAPAEVDPFPAPADHGVAPTGGDYGTGPSETYLGDPQPADTFSPEQGVPAPTESYGSPDAPPPPPDAPEFKRHRVEPEAGPVDVDGTVVGTLDAFTQVDILDEDPAPAAFFQPTPMDDLLDGDFDVVNPRPFPPRPSVKETNGANAELRVFTPRTHDAFPNPPEFKSYESSKSGRDESFDYLSNEVSAESAPPISPAEAAIFGDEPQTTGYGGYEYDGNYGANDVRRKAVHRNLGAIKPNRTHPRDPFTVSQDEYANAQRRKPQDRLRHKMYRHPELKHKEDGSESGGLVKAMWKGVAEGESFLPKLLQPRALTHPILGSRSPRTSEFDICLGHGTMAGLSALGFSSLLFAAFAWAALFNSRRGHRRAST